MKLKDLENVSLGKINDLIDIHIMSDRMAYAGDYPDWSGDISAAWKVVEKFNYYVDEEKFILNYLRGSIWPKGWHCVIGDTHFHGGKTAPEAICKAALLAVLKVE